MALLQNKNILISGGTTGMGRETALLLASQGAKVFIFGRNAEPLQKTLADITATGGIAHGMTGDASKLEDMQRIFQKFDETYGQLDVLINNAALPANSILNTEPEEWERVLSVNIRGYITGSRLAIDRMQKQGSGHIVNTGSLCIKVLDNGADLYVLTKTAVQGLSDSLRKKVCKDNIKITLLNPGGTASDMVTETHEEQKQMIEQGELLDPKNIANAILFCLSQPPQVDITELVIRPHQQSVL